MVVCLKRVVVGSVLNGLPLEPDWHKLSRIPDYNVGQDHWTGTCGRGRGPEPGRVRGRDVDADVEMSVDVDVV